MGGGHGCRTAGARSRRRLPDRYGDRRRRLGDGRPGCGAGALPASARFCHVCGAAQVIACATCGGELMPNGRFCPACGTPVTGPVAAADPVPDAPQGIAARRVTSVLFGDLVGFTTLAEGRDAEETRELLSTYFEESSRIIGSYGGPVEKFNGDTLLEEW